MKRRPTTDEFRIVFTFTSGANQPVTLASDPLDRATAMTCWSSLARTGVYTADSGHRVRVMSTDECAKAGIR